MIEIVAGITVLILAFVAAAVITRKKTGVGRERKVDFQKAMGALAVSRLYTEKFKRSLDEKISDATSPLVDAYTLLKEFDMKSTERVIPYLEHLAYLANVAKKEAYLNMKIKSIMSKVYSVLSMYKQGKLSRADAEFYIDRKLKELKYAIEAVTGPEKA
jgi:hydrogenase maturation factor HypE